MFTEDVARNLVVPDVTDDAGLAETVDTTVSTVLAVAYVPRYREKMRRKGFEAI